MQIRIVDGRDLNSPEKDSQQSGAINFVFVLFLRLMACKLYDTAQNYLCQTLPVSLVRSTRNHVKILSITVRASLPPSLVFLSWVHRANANMKLLCYFNIFSSAGEWDSCFPEKQKSPEIKKPHLKVYLLGSRPNKVEDAKNEGTNFIPPMAAGAATWHK